MEKLKFAITGIATTCIILIIFLGFYPFYWNELIESRQTVKTVYGDILFIMKVDKSRIHVGEQIEFNLTIKNEGEKRVTIKARAPVFDIYLYDSLGNLVAKYTDGRAFIALIIEIELKPGDNYTKTIRWNLYKYNETSGEFDPIKPGIYRVSGVCLTSTEPLMETDKITIKVLKE